MEEKIKTIDEIEDICIKLRQDKKKIVTTNGAFDILHYGHVTYLEKSKKEGDILIVLLNSDDSIKMLKGDKRPIIPEKERALILAALSCVDYVVIFNDNKPLDYIRRIKPYIHTKGAEVSGETRNFINNWGGEYKSIGLEKGLSTTNIVKTILERYFASSPNFE